MADRMRQWPEYIENFMRESGRSLKKLRKLTIVGGKHWRIQRSIKLLLFLDDFGPKLESFLYETNSEQPLTEIL